LGSTTDNEAAAMQLGRVGWEGGDGDKSSKRDRGGKGESKGLVRLVTEAGCAGQRR
jgi:hypothetical protein